MTQEAEVDSVFKLPKSFPSSPRPDHSYQFSIETWPLHKLGDHTSLAELKFQFVGVPRTVRMLLWPGWGDQEATSLEVRHKLLLTGRSEVKGSGTISKGFPLNRMRGYWLSGNVKSQII